MSGAGRLCQHGVRLWLPFLFAVAAMGCEPVAAVSCPSTTVSSQRRTTVQRLDVLFVIDTAPGMELQRARLRASLPRFIARLTEPASVDNRTEPFGDVHVAVVAADLGLTGGAAQGCSANGEDGVLRAADSCGIPAGSFASFHAGDPSASTGLHVLDCQIAAPASPCLVAQPLEAALKALWPPLPSDAILRPIQFLNGGTAHGARENRGFLHDPARDGSAELLIVLLTNRDDCSIAPDSSLEGPALLESCRTQPEQLAPFERYVDAFRFANGSPFVEHPFQRGVRFIILAGVPAGTRGWSPEQILSDPRMQWRTAAAGSGFQPSCTYQGSAAYPPRRLVQFAQAAGAQAVVRSLCEEDLLADLPLGRKIVPASQLAPGEACVPSGVPRNAAGLVPCTLLWELPAAGPGRIEQCADRPELLSLPGGGSEAVIGPHGGALCAVRQIPVFDPRRPPEPEGGEGFYFAFDLPDAGCASHARFSNTPGAVPPEGTHASTRCTRDLAYGIGPGERDPVLGAPCDFRFDGRKLVEGDARCSGPGSPEMFCHPDAHICLMRCQSDADCRRDWSCDTARAYPLTVSAGTPICIKPSCAEEPFQILPPATAGSETAP